MPPADPALRAWWPVTQAMDLVEAPLDQAAEAVFAVYQQIAGDRPARLDWIDVSSLDQAFIPPVG